LTPGQHTADHGCKIASRALQHARAAFGQIMGISMDGEVLASTSIDSVAKGRAQLLLNIPVPLSAELWRKLDTGISV